MRFYSSELKIESLQHSPGQGQGAGLGVGVWDLGCSVYTIGLGFRVQLLEFKIQV